MDGAKQFISTHGSFVNARRSLKDELSKSAAVFPACAAGDNGQPSEKDFPKISLFDTLQLNLGKKTVENATLAADILRLQHVVEELQKVRSNDYGAKCHEVAQLEADMLNQKLELNRIISDRNIFRTLHEEVIIELEKAKSQRAAEEKEVCEIKQNHQSRIGGLERLCQQFEEEKLNIEQRCIEQLEEQRKDFDNVLRNMKNIESVADVVALKEERSKHAEQIAALLNDRFQCQSRLQQSLTTTDDLQKAYASMEGKLKEQLSNARVAFDRHLKMCKEEKSKLEIELSNTETVLMTDLNLIRGEATRFEDKVKFLENALNEKESCLSLRQKEHEKEVSIWRQRVAEAASDNSKLVVETLAALECKLAESDTHRARLSAMNEQKAQEATEYLELVRKEYDNTIKSLAIQHEEDFKRRVSSIEEQYIRKVRQWKAEYEKIRDGQHEYARLFDTRLEQHVRSLKEAHSMELSSLEQQLKELYTSSADQQDQIVTVRRNLAGKDKDLKTVTKKASDFEKKYRTADKKIEELVVSNERLILDVTQLRELKDPSTIIEMTLQAERENLRGMVEAEHAGRVASSEALLIKQHEESTTMLQQSHNNALRQLQEQLNQAISERAQSRSLLHKLQSEVAAEKRTLDNRIAELVKNNTAGSIMDAQNYQIELRTKKENHNRELQQLKSEKAKALKTLESKNACEIQQIYGAHENERLALARNHEELLRSYKQLLMPSVRKEMEAELSQEMSAVRAQNSNLVASQNKVLTEAEQKLSSLLENTKRKHQETINDLQAKLSVMTNALTESEVNFARQQQSLDEAHSVKQSLEKLLAQTESGLQDSLKQEIGKRRTVQEEIRKEAEKKLSVFQETSTSTITRLEGQLKIVLREMAKVEERERLSAENLASTHARNRDLEKNQAAFHRRLLQSELRIPEMLASV